MPFLIAIVLIIAIVAFFLWILWSILSIIFTTIIDAPGAYTLGVLTFVIGWFTYNLISEEEKKPQQPSKNGDTIQEHVRNSFSSARPTLRENQSSLGLALYLLSVIFSLMMIFVGIFTFLEIETITGADFGIFSLVAAITSIPLLLSFALNNGTLEAPPIVPAVLWGLLIKEGTNNSKILFIKAFTGTIIMAGLCVMLNALTMLFPSFFEGANSIMAGALVGCFLVTLYLVWDAVYYTLNHFPYKLNKPGKTIKRPKYDRDTKNKLKLQDHKITTYKKRSKDVEQLIKEERSRLKEKIQATEELSQGLLNEDKKHQLEKSNTQALETLAKLDEDAAIAQIRILKHEFEKMLICHSKDFETVSSIISLQSHLDEDAISIEHLKEKVTILEEAKSDAGRILNMHAEQEKSLSEAVLQSTCFHEFNTHKKIFSGKMTAYSIALENYRAAVLVRVDEKRILELEKDQIAIRTKLELDEEYFDNEIEHRHAADRELFGYN